MILSCNTLEAMKIWGELVQCYYGENKYASTTAEIYSYKLEPYTPALHKTYASGLEMEDAVVYTRKDIEKFLSEAAMSLAEIVEQFCIVFDCDAIMDGKTIEEWKKKISNKEGLMRRYHVEIIND